MPMNTSTTSSTATHVQPAPKPLKRLACDDCRARKVSCSGEETGCARCRRSGVTCVYSPPKQPGRPRKIRRTDPPPPSVQPQPRKRAFDDTGICSESDVSDNIVASLPFPDLGAPFSATDTGGFLNFFQEDPVPPILDIQHG
ncbi:hypothetical protein EX30DRAFT_334049 [Ascodesmis nigricans]|uniref:Zn(2)-C6 fungal-type domain-containing protein n=1 Tax=Ascodesmis nigricans TaxID=341454 RepID=A0A4S2MSD2_9PEZI|nr:hypothetical protein EX30DRAFT_334049 [Ascodesmis nigricans]